MKNITRLSLAVVLAAAAVCNLRADSGYSFDFVLSQKKAGDSKAQDKKGVSVKDEKWSYAVTVVNKSFKDVPGFQIKYVVFSKPDNAGKAVKPGQVDLERHAGTATIGALRNNDQTTFYTEPVELRTVQLDSGWEWKSGSDTYARGALRGIWIRVYIGDQLVAEFKNPANLADVTTFDPPAKGN